MRQHTQGTFPLQRVQLDSSAYRDLCPLPPGILPMSLDSALICIQPVPHHLPQGLPIFVAASGCLGKPLLSLGGLWAQVGPTSFS